MTNENVTVNRGYKDRLFKHQSSYSPNLPLRGLFYFADLYRKLIGNKRDIYSSKLIMLPTPQFIIFYNGSAETTYRERILSDIMANLKEFSEVFLHKTRRPIAILIRLLPGSLWQNYKQSLLPALSTENI